MFSLLGTLLSGTGRKMLVYGGIVLSVVLVLFGAYRAGGKAAEATGTKKALDRTLRNIRTRQEVEHEIATSARDGKPATERLRDRWSRD